ncbi:MAG: hypothetical protein KF900_04860 [Bacteroidetes bacterium]|nr:hypothetical protein [Bacteroidota bacterium]
MGSPEAAHRVTHGLALRAVNQPYLISVKKFCTLAYRIELLLARSAILCVTRYDSVGRTGCDTTRSRTERDTMRNPIR